jgi:hypothetical protein
MNTDAGFLSGRWPTGTNSEGQSGLNSNRTAERSVNISQLRTVDELIPRWIRKFANNLHGIPKSALHLGVDPHKTAECQLVCRWARRCVRGAEFSVPAGNRPKR